MIKAFWPLQKVSNDGIASSIRSSFRLDDNYDGCLNDYTLLLKEDLSVNAAFYEGCWKSNTEIYQEATFFLTGKHPTDTKCVQNVNGLNATYDDTEHVEPAVRAEINSNGRSVRVANYSISSGFRNRIGQFECGADFAAAEWEGIYTSTQE